MQQIIAGREPAINKILSRYGISPLTANNIQKSAPHAEAGMITGLTGSSELLAIGATNGICTGCQKLLGQHGVIPATAMSFPNRTP